jgi:hypothetical protein
MRLRTMHIGSLSEIQKEKDLLKDKKDGMWVIVKWMLERWDEVVSNGLIWLRIGIGGGLLGNELML